MCCYIENTVHFLTPRLRCKATQQSSLCCLPTVDQRCACPCDEDAPVVCALCCYVCCGPPQSEPESEPVGDGSKGISFPVFEGGTNTAEEAETPPVNANSGDGVPDEGASAVALAVAPAAASGSHGSELKAQGGGKSAGAACVVSV